MKKFKLGELVVIVIRGVRKIGVLKRRWVRKKRRVFDVVLENGDEITYVPVNEERATYYIDAHLSKEITPKVITNLKLASGGNFR